MCVGGGGGGLPSSGLHNMVDFRIIGSRKIFRLTEKKQDEVVNFEMSQ